MKNYIYVFMLSCLLFGCNNNSSQTEREYIKNLEEKNRALEEELREKTSQSQGSNNETQTSETSKAYFKIGSTEDEVLEVMGDPTTLRSLGSFGKIYYYGLSSVSFENGKVESYNNMDGNLKVKVKD